MEPSANTISTEPSTDSRKPQVRRQRRRLTVDRLELESYDAWQQRRAEIRQWLVEQIAERAIEIFQARRNGS